MKSSHHNHAGTQPSANNKSVWSLMKVVGEFKLLFLVLLLSLVLNMWGSYWGTPDSWHPDEITERTITMVQNRTLNSHFFAYGSLHYYVLAVGAVLPVQILVKVCTTVLSKEVTWLQKKAYIKIMARSVSAIMSVLVVLITFIISHVLFQKRISYIAAALLSVSMLFVAIAHFATVDSAGNFWYWLSCLLALLMWKRNNRLCYVLAAITAGFAIGLKTDRVVILFPLLVSHFFCEKRVRLIRLLVWAFIIATGYIIANPMLLFQPFEFLDGYTRDMFFNALRGGPKQHSYITIFEHLKSGLSVPLFMGVCFGLVYAFYALVRQRHTRSLLWLLSTIMPYYLLLGSKLIPIWYLPFFFPALMILFAYAFTETFDKLPKPYKILGNLALVSIFVCAFLHTVVLIRQFPNDTRYLAAQWIQKNIPKNATIEIGPKGPIISLENYRVKQAPPDKNFYDFARDWSKNLENHKLYQRIRKAILDLEELFGKYSGFPVRNEPYLAWFDRIKENDEKNLINEKNPPPYEHPTYIVLIDYLQKKRYAVLSSSNSGYELLKQFEYQDTFLKKARFKFVNPKVFIFQRKPKAN